LAHIQLDSVDTRSTAARVRRALVFVYQNIQTTRRITRVALGRAYAWSTHVDTTAAPLASKTEATVIVIIAKRPLENNLNV